MEKDKKEKTYWDVKESEIDENLLKKIIKYQRLALITTLIYLPVVMLNLVLQLLNQYIDRTLMLVFSSIIIIVALGVIVLYIIYIVNILKLKKQVKQAAKQEEKNNKQD